MTLNGNLYTIVGTRDEGAGFAYTVRLDAGCFIYKAHFPGNPITPGVCILQIMTELLEHRLGRRLTLKTINNVKYLTVISPLEQETIDYVFAAPTVDGDTLKVKAVVKNASADFAKITATYY